MTPLLCNPSSFQKQGEDGQKQVTTLHEPCEKARAHARHEQLVFPWAFQRTKGGEKGGGSKRTNEGWTFTVELMPAPATKALVPT